MMVSVSNNTEPNTKNKRTNKSGIERKNKMTNVLATKLNALSISNLKEVLNLIDGILVVFEKYDGKQITKRIEKALKEVNDDLYLKIGKD